MKKTLIFLYLILQLTAVRAQYPAALPSSGSLSIQTIYNWMLAAGEVAGPPENIFTLNSNSHLADKTAPYSLSDWYGYAIVAIPFTSCGNPFVVAHTAGTVAPETKMVNYKTVTTSLSGTSKCWITQNLGAANPAASATDATDAAAGWYWQWNKMQGYKVGTTPAWPGSYSYIMSDWSSANDPCTLALGVGWRLPTNTEWNTVITTGGWNGDLTGYSSVLKLHDAGYIALGVLYDRGVDTHYWSSVNLNINYGNSLAIMSGLVQVNGGYKSYGYPVRCLR